MKVVSTPTMVMDRSITSVDSLEESLVYNALFLTGFLKYILAFQKHQNAPLRAHLINVVPGNVMVRQTFGDYASLYPHLHVLVANCLFSWQQIFFCHAKTEKKLENLWPQISLPRWLYQKMTSSNSWNYWSLSGGEDLLWALKWWPKGQQDHDRNHWMVCAKKIRLKRNKRQSQTCATYRLSVLVLFEDIKYGF